MTDNAQWRRFSRRVLPLLLASAGLSGCAMHWPWHHRAPPVAPAVHEITIAADDSGAVSSAAIVQYWDRNTLLLDLTGLSGEGQVTLLPIMARGGWPVRLEFRVRPGSFGRLEVRADQRVLFAVPAQGTASVLKLAPGVFAPATKSITLRWTSADG